MNDHPSPPPLPDAPRWLSVGFVGLMVLFLPLAYLLHEPLYLRMIQKEGPVEYLTVLVLLPGIIAGLLVFAHRRALPARWLGYWGVLCSAGLVYFGGEELSWGQHVFHWEAPESMQEINDQNETNLHNISTFFGRKPKQVVEIWTVVGCIIVPLVLAKRRPPLDPARDWTYWFWPTRACMPAAILATLVYVPTRLAKVSMDTVPVELRLSEVQEYYFAVTLMIYVVSMGIRAAGDRATRGGGRGDSTPDPRRAAVRP